MLNKNKCMAALLCRPGHALSSGTSECTFSPAINPTSRRMLHQSGDLPLDFLERQHYFDRQAKENKQLLQLATEDPECRFRPQTQDVGARGTGR